MINIKKVIYFIIAIIVLILMSLIILNHMRNLEYVSGDVENKEVVEEILLKTIVDEKTNIEICYGLTKEINDSDILIIKDKEITSRLKKKGIIKYFSISLYDELNKKKSFVNSEMTINITLDQSLKKYDELKVVRINSKNEITNEIFETIENDNQLIFNINMSSKYAIIGIKYSKQK